MSAHTPDWVKDFTGIPFREKGRDRSGCDCWGIVRLALDEHFGICDLPDYVDTYTSTMDRDSVDKAIRSGLLLGWEHVDQPGTGDLIILKPAGKPWHCGLMVNKLEMLHTLQGCNSTVERIDTFLWRNRIEGFFRYAA
jgi:cell wall-associated NlpC family hydrolase